MFSLLFVGPNFFNTELQLFGLDLLVPSHKFWCQDVLSQVRSGAVTFCRRRTRICLFSMRHWLFFLSNFAVESFSMGDGPVHDYMEH